MSKSTSDLFIGDIEIFKHSTKILIDAIHFQFVCFVFFFHVSPIWFHCIIFIDLAFARFVYASEFLYFGLVRSTCLDIDSIKINFSLICRRWSFGCDGIYCRCASMSKCYLHFTNYFVVVVYFILFFCFVVRFTSPFYPFDSWFSICSSWVYLVVFVSC